MNHKIAMFIDLIHLGLFSFVSLLINNLDTIYKGVWIIYTFFLMIKLYLEIKDRNNNKSNNENNQ